MVRPLQDDGPVIDQLSEELAGKVVVGKINVDEQQELAVRYGVMSIPTVVLFRGGKEDKRSVGLCRRRSCSPVWDCNLGRIRI